MPVHNSGKPTTTKSKTRRTEKKNKQNRKRAWQENLNEKLAKRPRMEKTKATIAKETFSSRIASNENLSIDSFVIVNYF